jgi:predicted lipoprotein with Yx(FWY)xxD motif
MKKTTCLFVLCSLIVVTGCGSNGSSAYGSSSQTSNSSSSSVIGTSSVSGLHLVDGSGRTLYQYSGDSAGVSNCTGSCASVWPPLTISAGQNTSVTGSALQSSISTIHRTDGSTQVTYGAKPLYYFESDTSPGQITGNGVGGFSLVSP